MTYPCGQQPLLLFQLGRGGLGRAQHGRIGVELVVVLLLVLLPVLRECGKARVKCEEGMHRGTWQRPSRRHKNVPRCQACVARHHLDGQHVPLYDEYIGGFCCFSALSSGKEKAAAKKSSFPSKRRGPGLD